MAPLAEKRNSEIDERQARAELRDSLPGIALILGGMAILGLVDPQGLSPWNVVWAMVALGSVGWFVWVEARSLRRADEYQRIMRLEALAVGFAAVMVLSFAGGLLDELGVVDARASLSVTVGAGVVAWVTALGVKTKRGR
jgi:hypothetical protein